MSKDLNILSTNCRGLGPPPTYVSSKEPWLTQKTRFAILFIGQKASATRIVAGAVQDFDIDVVVSS